TFLLVVDQSGSTRVGSPVSRAARATEVAAVLALAGAREQDRVGGVIFTSEVEHVVPPAKGRRHVLRLIRDLLAFTPRHQGTDVARALGYVEKVLAHRSVVVLLSDFLASDWDGPLRELAARHDVSAVTVDDDREIAPRGLGWIEFEDAETGMRALVDTGNPEAQRRWHAAALARRQDRNQRLRAAGVRHLQIEVHQDYA